MKLYLKWQGTKIENQLQLIKMVKELSMEKNTYIKVNEAINKVKTTGYGIVIPDLAGAFYGKCSYNNGDGGEE